MGKMKDLTEILFHDFQGTFRRDGARKSDLQLHPLKSFIDRDLLNFTWYSFSNLRQIFILRSLHRKLV